MKSCQWQLTVLSDTSGASHAGVTGQPDHPLFQVQEKLLLSACHLLVSLATTVRPVFLISIPAVQKVFNRITDTSAQQLPDKVIVWSMKCVDEVSLRSCALARTVWGITSTVKGRGSSYLCPVAMQESLWYSLSVMIYFKQQNKEKSQLHSLDLIPSSIVDTRQSLMMHSLYGKGTLILTHKSFFLWNLYYYSTYLTPS